MYWKEKYEGYIRPWLKFYFEKEPRPVLFYISLAIDIMLVIFIMYFITTINSGLQDMVENSKNCSSMIVDAWNITLYNDSFFRSTVSIPNISNYSLY